MICAYCSKDLSDKKSKWQYCTLVCNTNDNAIFTFPYCNPMCLALDWKVLEAEA
jgi:hypothetical protein